MTAEKLYRSVAAGDLVLFSVLAVPGLGGLVFDWVLRLNTMIGLGGSAQATAALLLFLHLMGLMGAALAYLRLRIGASTDGVRATVCVKLAAAALFALFVWHGAPAVLIVFGAIDLAQAVAILALHSRQRGLS